MLKRLLAASLALLVSGVFAWAASLQINGTDSQHKQQIFWMGVPRISRDESATATPSGSVTTSYVLTAGITYITAVASAGDGVRLPITTGPAGGTGVLGGGLQMVINNGHATNAVNLFPFQAADIITNNGANAGAGAALSIPALKTAVCFVVIDGRWACQIG